MRIRVSHQIVHRFDPSARTVNQILRLTPLSFDSQYVLRWRLDIDADGALRAFAAEATSGADSPLDSMHRLMAALHEALPLHLEEKDAAGSAIEAFALRRARARDFAHIFIACARWRGIPARFVSGYRLVDGSAEAGAHEWAEVYIPEFGWGDVAATVP